MNDTTRRVRPLARVVPLPDLPPPVGPIALVPPRTLFAEGFVLGAIAGAAIASLLLAWS